MEAPCEYLEWDSRFFGVEIARVTTGQPTAAELVAIEQWSTVRHIACLYLLVDGTALQSTRDAEDAGFRLVDVRMTLARPVAQPPLSSAAGFTTIALRPTTDSDLPALRAIARSSHHDSRFYRDGRFPTERCDALYETWIEKSYRGWVAAVWVGELDGAVAGYVTCERPTDTTGRIGLFAVEERVRGHGIGAALVMQALRWFEERGIARVSVVTQGVNVGAQRLYQACGFRTESVQLWFHRWRRHGGGA